MKRELIKTSEFRWRRWSECPQCSQAIRNCRLRSPLPGYCGIADRVQRKPDRPEQKQPQTKKHWTKIEERYLTQAFKAAREGAGC